MKFRLLIILVLYSLSARGDYIDAETAGLVKIHDELVNVRNMVVNAWNEEKTRNMTLADKRIIFKYPVLLDEINSLIGDIDRHIDILQQSPRFERFTLDVN